MGHVTRALRVCKGCWEKCEGWEHLRICFIGECDNWQRQWSRASLGKLSLATCNLAFF